MKTHQKIFPIITILLINAFFGYAQSTKEIDVDGLKIVLKKVPKEVFTASLFIRGGVANVKEDQQGIESFAIQLALDGGTTSMDKDAFSTLADKLGTSFNSSASKDFSSMTMRCLSTTLDKSWDMFMDAILHPAMDSNEFKLIKQQMIAGARQQDANPDSYLRKLSIDAIFKGTPYDRLANGTPESLEKLSYEDVRNYYSHLLGKKNCYLVIVGNISENNLISKIKSSLSKLPEGTSAPKNELNGVTKADVNIKDRTIATNYILGSVNGPKYFSEDGPLFEFAMSIIQDRYFVELRTKRSLSYAPAAFYNKGLISNPLGQLYISTTDPKQSLQVMTDIINDVKKNGFSEKEVADKKKQYMTTYFMTNESGSAQAATLGFCEASGNWRIFDEVNTKIDRVQTADLNRVFDKYMNRIAWTYLGKKDKVTEEDFRQPEASKEKMPASKLVQEKKE